MKKNTFFCSLAMAATVLTGCGTQGSQVLSDVLMGSNSGGVIGAVTGQGGIDALGNVIASVLGVSTRPTKQQLIGSWTYAQPGCAFMSDQLLAQAGGEVVAAQIKAKLAPYYQSIGVSSSNTMVTFKQDGSFTSKFAGMSFNGNYTFDENSGMVTMKGLLLTINAYAKRNVDGIALLFESSKLLTLLQTVSAMSGNVSIQSVGELSKSYNGLRLGFDFRK